MKRQEAVDIITDIIHENRRRTEICTSIELAEMILDTLENVGMQPPSRPNDYGALNNLGTITLINEWENE